MVVVFANFLLTFLYISTLLILKLDIFCSIPNNAEISYSKQLSRHSHCV